MRNIKRYWLLSLALLPQAFTGMALGAEPVSPTQFLLEQVRLGKRPIETNWLSNHYIA